MNNIEGRFVYGDNVYINDEYMDEKWARITGFPSYMISDKGRVWSEKSQQFLKNKPLDSHGHLGVCLSKGVKKFYRYIHRLVAEAFIPNPNNHPVVRHIEDDPSQNCKEDLLWGTQYDNIHDSIRNGRAYRISPEDREKGLERSRTPLVARNVENGETYIFRSQAEASRKLNIPQANIHKVLNGIRPQAKGYAFEYINKEGYHVGN